MSSPTTTSPPSTSSTCPPTPSSSTSTPSTSSASPATTTTTTSTPNPGDMKYNLKIKLIHLLVSKMVLYIVLVKGSSGKDPGVDMITYLTNLHPSTSTANYVKLTDKQRKNLKFDATQKTKINQCTSGETFDVTLLFKCIQYACEGLKGLYDDSWWTDGPELENCIYMIKQHRNDSEHGVSPITKAEFEKMEKDLRQLFINTVNALQQRYKDSMTIKERDDLIKEIEGKLDRIKDGDLPKLRRECQEEVKTKLQLSKHFNPVSFIIGSMSLAVDVTHVFTEIEIVHGEHQAARDVSYQDFIAEIHKDKKHKVVLLEGVAGAGKTTLTSFMLQEWCAGHDTIKELSEYEVILHVVCRDQSTDSYRSLVEKSLPKTFTQFKEDTLPLLSQCRILVLIDGLDEANQASKKLVKDVLDQLKGADATIICATRPEGRRDFQNMAGSSIPCMNASIKGIPVNKRLDFLEKNHLIIKQQTNSGRDSGQLLELMKEKMVLEHFRLPLNLILAGWVYDQDPDALHSSTTQTQLYYHTHRLSKMKLQERLSNCMNKCPDSEDINDWITKLYKQSLVSLSLDQLVLSEEADKSLQKEAKTRGLPADEMLGAFLTLKCTTPGRQQKYSAPHKGIQDYYAALYVVQKLKENQSASRTKIKRILENAIGKNIRVHELNKYQNVLQHMAGILHLFMAKLPNDLLEELVNLIGDAGVENDDQWLNVIEETNKSPAVLAAIAKIVYPGKAIEIEITDGRVNAGSALLAHIYTSLVHINIENSVSTNLEPLVDCLGRHKYELNLIDTWEHPNPDFSPQPSILKLFSRDGIVQFIGQWTSGMENMSSSLENLRLSVADGTKVSLLVSLLHLLPHLKFLTLEVPPSVSPEGLTPLPTLPRPMVDAGVHLYLTDVKPGGESRACEVTASLMPQNGELGLWFPGATLSPEEWRVMLKTLGRLGVRAKFINAPVPPTPDDYNLKPLAKQHLGADFGRTHFR